MQARQKPEPDTRLACYILKEGRMKTTLTIVMALLVCCSSAFAKNKFVLEPGQTTPEQIGFSVDRALKGIAILDPSFVLKNVTLKAPNKQGVIDVCYSFTSRTFSGRLSGTARLNSDNKIDSINFPGSGSDLGESYDPCSLAFQAVTLSIFPQVQAVLKAKTKIGEPETGTISFSSPHYDTTASIDAGGTTYFSGCNTTDSSVSCSGYTGSAIITLQSGVWFPYHLEMRAGVGDTYTVCDSEDVCDPLRNLMMTSIGANGPLTFKYHMVVEPWEYKPLVPFTSVNAHFSETYYCVDFSITDVNGKEKAQTKCYKLIFEFLQNADYTPFIKPAPDPYRYH